jgi:phage terminase large subunit-like protein
LLATAKKPSLKKTLKLIPGYDPWRDAGDCWLDEDAARRAIDFFSECLKFVEDGIVNKAGDPFILEPWQAAIVGNIFGWKRSDGTRRYRKAIIFVAGKNGKSPLAAGISLYCFACLGERGAQVALLAYTKEQAGIVWRWAKGFVHQDADLSDRIKPYQYEMRLNSDPSSTYKPIASEEKSIHGLNLSTAVADEIHTYESPDELNTLKTRFASRKEPLLVEISTAGWDRNSIGWEEYTYAKGVIEGQIVDPYTLPVVYEPGPNDDWTAESTWRKANPNLGVSVSLEYMREKCEEAKISPAFRNTFLQVHCNRWTEQAVRFFPMELWDNQPPRRPLDELDSLPCYGGLDLAEKRDLAGFTLVFPDASGGYDVRAWAWVPEDTAREREKTDRVPYRQWAEAGMVKLTPGDIIDFECVKQDIVDLYRAYRILEIGFDRRFATQITTQLREEFGIPCIEIPQTYAHLSEPMKLSLDLLKAGKLRHGNNKLLRWQASNTAVITARHDEGLVRPMKGKSHGRIDNITALIMALARAIANANKGSYYSAGGGAFVV